MNLARYAEQYYGGPTTILWQIKRWVVWHKVRELGLGLGLGLGFGLAIPNTNPNPNKVREHVYTLDYGIRVRVSYS